MIQSFEDLECWKAAVEIRKEISQLAKTFPAVEKYRLADQIVRSSRSTTAQIAEGYGRFHYQENIQYCRQGRGSLYETLDHLRVALEEGYMSEIKYHELKDKIYLSIRLLNGYINYLSKAKSNSETHGNH